MSIFAIGAMSAEQLLEYGWNCSYINCIALNLWRY